MKGGGAAGVAMVGAAGVEVAQQVLTETQPAILPLVPYLNTLRWVCIAVALGGIAVNPWARGALRYGAIAPAIRRCYETALPVPSQLSLARPNRA